MKLTIWKFLLPLGDNIVSMPKGSRFLHVSEQSMQVHVWVLCDPEAPLVQHYYCIFGTGHPPTGSGTYVGSAHCGPFVWHVFDCGEVEEVV